MVRGAIYLHSEEPRHRSPVFDAFCKRQEAAMIRKLKSGEYRLYSRKKGDDGKRRNLGTFGSKEAAQKHERDVQYFKRH
jgi:hypothetical protein